MRCLMELANEEVPKDPLAESSHDGAVGGNADRGGFLFYDARLVIQNEFTVPFASTALVLGDPPARPPHPAGCPVSARARP